MMKNGSKKQIVISGFEMVSPWGLDFYSTMKQFESKTKNPHLQSNASNVERVNITKLDELLGKRGLKHMNPATKFGVFTAGSCFRKSHLDSAGYGLDSGVIIGSHLGHIDVYLKMMETINAEGAEGLSPLDSGNAAINVIASTIGIKLGAKAINTTINNGFTSALDSIIYSYNMIANDRAKYLVTGATECISPYFIEWLKAHGYYSIYEGAGMLLIEERETAEARGLKPFCEIKGFHSIPQNKPDTQEHNIHALLDSCFMNPRDIDICICSGGNLTNEYFGRMGMQGRILDIRKYVGDGLSLTGLFQVMYGLYILESEGPRNIFVHLSGDPGNTTSLVLSRCADYLG